MTSPAPASRSATTPASSGASKTVNPQHSLPWCFPELIELIAVDRVPKTIDVTYDACMLGGERPKHQRIRTTCLELAALSSPPYGACDGAHHHKPWGVHASGSFNNAEEAEYPHKFCHVVAQLLSKHMPVPLSSPPASRTVAAIAAAKPPVRTPAELQHRHLSARRKAAAGLQPRGRAHGPLIPGHAARQFVKVSGNSAAELASLLRTHTKDSELHLGNKTFPQERKSSLSATFTRVKGARRT